MKRPLLIYCSAYVLGTALAILHTYMAAALFIILLLLIYISEKYVKINLCGYFIGISLKYILRHGLP